METDLTITKPVPLSTTTSLSTNSTINTLNISRTTPKKLISSLDENTKEIILLATNIITLLLLTLFVIFLLWNCYIKCRKKKEFNRTTLQRDRISLSSLRAKQKTLRPSVATKQLQDNSVQTPLEQQPQKHEVGTMTKHKKKIYVTDTELDVTTDAETRRKRYSKSLKAQRSKLKQEVNRINEAYEKDDIDTKFHNKLKSHQNFQHLNKMNRLTQEEIKKEFYTYTLQNYKKLTPKISSKQQLQAHSEQCQQQGTFTLPIHIEKTWQI